MEIDEGPMERSSDTSTALVVDDENMNVFFMRNTLKGLGISCDSTMVPTKAVKLVEERLAKVALGTAKMYKLLLIDYSMPDLDGIELVKKLRAMIDASQLCEEQPIYCCCTAYDTEEHHDIAIQSGFNYFMVKPVNKDDLQEILEKHGIQ